ncbi:endolytic transglycosylase MltG [Caproiciproducens faecalis]|uniref:Endolytic murein transglycosylase n=1 Tax=Caproiciproducens faecalis TaxID=2820301 RepID=A0ABS7DKF5_9FIRM|nr:endolytic transglycosylase MltG [Caproiciproducens faecalis]MBW7571758.1 endolytic transglycosylase MltG [Caproiciproducens faecalis]
MKQYLAMLTALAVCFSFSACSKSNTSSTVSSQASSSVVSESDSSVPDSSDSTVSSSVLSSAVSSAGAVTSQGASSQKQNTSSAPASSSQPEKAQTVRVVIPEGYTLSQIGDRLEANGVCKKSELLSTANSYDFSYYSLIGKLGSSASRCYKLEGYLFPDTYEFYKDMKPQDALGKMLKNAESRIGGNYSYSGMTTDQVVTLASIIEKESGNVNEMAKVSSVFHNRLKAGMKLQADVTVIYVEKYLKPNLTGDINRYNSYYNTRKCPALPAGAICNPGKAALNAAVNPADTDYLYFAADASGNYYYAKTYEEHKQNLTKAGIIEGGSMQ